MPSNSDRSCPPNAKIWEDFLTSDSNRSCPSNADSRKDFLKGNSDKSCPPNANNGVESDLPDDVPNHPFVGYCIRHSYTLED